MWSVKRIVFRAVVVWGAFCSLYSAEGRTKDVRVCWRDEWNQIVDKRVDEKMNAQMDSRIRLVDERYRNREQDVLDICEKEIDFLTNKINFLGILLTFAGIVAVVMPFYAGLKIRASFENSKTAIARAEEAILKAESARNEGLKNKAQLNFVSSKNSFRQYVALSGKQTIEIQEFKPDTVGALFVGVEEMRKNFMAQAFIFIERAIAYNVECNHNKAARANLAALAFYLTTIRNNHPDDDWLRRRLHGHIWTCSIGQIREAMQGFPQGDKSKNLVESYAVASEEYGVRAAAGKFL